MGSELLEDENATFWSEMNLGVYPIMLIIKNIMLTLLVSLVKEN